jgi:hypothetical protein
MKQQSLKDRIKAARTGDEVEVLLEEGSNYETASPITRRSWFRTAQAVVNQLRSLGK